MGTRGARAVGALAAAALVLAGCTPDGLTPSTLVEPRLRPAPAVVVPVSPFVVFADEALAGMTLRQKIASLFMLRTPGTSGASLASFVEAHQPGGLILMADNIPASLPDLETLIDAASRLPGLPLITGIDQEGGIVRRIKSDEAAAAAQLKYLPASAAREAFAARGVLLNGAGVSVNFGIVADETSDAASFIFPRVLGTDPASASERVAQAVAGEEGLVLSTLKHFPGHGVAPGDSHFSIPTTSMSYAEWRATHALPFVAGIAAGADFVMMGHLRFTEVDERPASLSPVWHQTLRDELGFSGVIITDDMLMLQRSGEAEYASLSKNAIDALAAGSTMLLYVLPAQPALVGFDRESLLDEIEAAVGDGRIDAGMIDAAAHQLLVLRRQLSGYEGPYERCESACSREIG